MKKTTFQPIDNVNQVDNLKNVKNSESLGVRGSGSGSGSGSSSGSSSGSGSGSDMPPTISNIEEDSSTFPITWKTFAH